MSKIIEDILLFLPVVSFLICLSYGALSQNIWIMFVGVGVGLAFLHIRFTYESKHSNDQYAQRSRT